MNRKHEAIKADLDKLTKEIDNTLEGNIKKLSAEQLSEVVKGLAPYPFRRDTGRSQPMNKIKQIYINALGKPDLVAEALNNEGEPFLMNPQNLPIHIKLRIIYLSERKLNNG